MTNTYEQKSAALSVISEGAQYIYLEVIEGDTPEQAQVQLVSSVQRDDIVNVLISALSALGARVDPGV